MNGLMCLFRERQNNRLGAAADATASFRDGSTNGAVNNWGSIPQSAATQVRQKPPADSDTPLYNSRIINTYLEYLQQFHPEIEIDSVLRAAGMTALEVEDPGHWFSQRQTDRFHDIIALRTGNPHIARDAGRFTVSSKRLGAAKQYALGLINLTSIYLRAGKLVMTMSRGAVMTAKKLASNKVEITSVPTPGTMEKPYQCENRIGTLEAVPGLVHHKFAEVEHPACIHRGDDCCRYIVTWEKSAALIWQQVSRAAPFIGLAGCLTAYPFVPGRVWGDLVLGCAFIILLIFLRAERLTKAGLVTTIENQGNAARELIDEINIRHRNAQLIQEIGQAVARILDEQPIAQSIMTVVEKHLCFDRGMILLAGPASRRLHLSASFGYTEEQQSLLRNHEFNLETLVGDELIIRSFHEQKPFLVKDVAGIIEQASSKRRELMHRMGVQSFVCLPIVYEKQSLGVMVVENNNLHRQPGHSEMNLLMGVASQTALSIINARSVKTIRKSEQKYRLLADNSSDIIWVFDPFREQLTYVSPSVARVLGFAPEEYMGLDLTAIFTPGSLEHARTVIGKELAAEKKDRSDFHRSRVLELEQYRKDGSTLWIEVTATFVRNKQGRIVSILGASRDISERKQAEQEKKELEVRLQQAHKMEAIGTLAGGIAHDFNNILGAVLGYTEMSLEDADPGSLIHSNLQEVLTAGTRAKDLVKQILAFSRQAEQELRPIQVKLIVNEAIKLLRASLPSTIEIRRRITSDSATLADATQIHQVMMNLCTNAHHAMTEEGGILEVGLTDVKIDNADEARKLDLSPGAYLCLTVADTGCGMPPEVIARIYDPFFTTKGRDKGTGMGLAVVHGIVKSHGGAVRVDSQPGRGTTFEVFLPVIQQAAKASATVDTVRLPTGSEQILFVDDEKALVDLGRQMLERLGYKVICRTSSIEALELFKIRPEQFDLVITDMTMPNLTGDKLAAELKRIRPNIPVILCTGFSEQISEESVRNMELQALVFKPMVMSKLARTVRKALDESRVRKINPRFSFVS